MDLGKSMDNSEIDGIIKEQKPEDCALLVYTVSPTHPPKPLARL